MGSTQRPDVDGFLDSPPFDSTQDYFLLKPPEPAPGAPLLSAAEAKLLSNFFEDVNSDSYQTTSYAEGLNFTSDWLTLPGNLVGTATYPSSPAQAAPGALAFAGSTFASSISPNPPLLNTATHSVAAAIPPPLPQSLLSDQQASAEVLAAATVLQKGVITHRSHDNSSVPRAARSSLGAPGQHLRHQPLPDFRRDGTHLAQSPYEHPPEHLFADMMFGSSDPQPGHSGTRPVDLPRWGSDSNFGKAGFVPESPRDTAKAVEDSTLKNYMSLLGVDKITDVPNASNQAQDPVMVSPLNLRTSRPSAVLPDAEYPEAPPRKRRKSGIKEESEESEDDTTTASAGAAPRAPPRRRKSRVDSTSNGRRRKSTATGGPKAPRENLSEEQKRENHIKSEQKRRTLIKDGFDDLCELVPGLKGGGYSKSTMLGHAADWLEKLLRGNQELRDQLAQLEGR